MIMEENELIVRARLEDICDEYDRIKIYAFLRQNKLIYRPEGELKYKEAKPGELLNPIMKINKHEAQVLMDDLWLCGLRPSEGTGSAGSLKKTENHLADMRKIVFHKLGINNDRSGTKT